MGRLDVCCQGLGFAICSGHSSVYSRTGTPIAPLCLGSIQFLGLIGFIKNVGQTLGREDDTPQAQSRKTQISLMALRSRTGSTIRRRQSGVTLGRNQRDRKGGPYVVARRSPQ
jgi:hypothetical protein